MNSTMLGYSSDNLSVQRLSVAFYQKFLGRLLGCTGAGDWDILSVDREGKDATRPRIRNVCSIAQDLLPVFESKFTPSTTQSTIIIVFIPRNS